MLSKKPKNLIGVDVGARSIKIAEIVEKKKGPLVLNKLGIADIPDDTISAGVIKDGPIASDILAQLFKSEKIKNSGVATAIGGHAVIVKKIDLPAMNETELGEAIQFEAEKYIPFDISEVNLDYYIVGRNEINKNRMDVFLVAAKKDVIDSWDEMVGDAGLTIHIMDVEHFALQNAFTINYPEYAPDTIALLDIGASKTLLNIVRDDTSIFTRDMSLGCSQVNQKIMSVVKADYEEAEDIKLGRAEEGMPSLPDYALEDINRLIVDEFCTEIVKAFDFYASTYFDAAIKTILVSGGGAFLPGLREELNKRTKIEVDVFDSFRNINVAGFDLDFLQQNSPQMAMAVGLALRKAGDR